MRVVVQVLITTAFRRCRTRPASGLLARIYLLTWALIISASCSMLDVASIRASCPHLPPHWGPHHFRFLPDAGRCQHQGFLPAFISSPRTDMWGASLRLGKKIASLVGDFSASVEEAAAVIRSLRILIRHLNDVIISQFKRCYWSIQTLLLVNSNVVISQFKRCY
jgi:hypothetical protein